MKFILCLSALVLSSFTAQAVDFGAEADKSAAAGKRTVLVERKHPVTGERVAFELSLDAKKAAELKALGADTTSGKKLEELVRDTVGKIDRDAKEIALVEGTKSTKVTNSPTTAWCGIYYGYIVYRFVYYVRITYYVPFHGYYWAFHY